MPKNTKHSSKSKEVQSNDLINQTSVEIEKQEKESMKTPVITIDEKTANITPMYQEKKKSKWWIFLLLGLVGFCCVTVLCIGIVALVNSGKSETTKSELGEATLNIEALTSEPIKTEKSNDGNEYPVNELFFMLKSGTNKSVATDLATSVQGEIVGNFDYLDLYLLQTQTKSGKELDALIKKIKANANVESVGKNFLFEDEVTVKGTPCSIYEDTMGQNENKNMYELIGLEKGWQYIKASGVDLKEVNVGVVDSGLQEGLSDVGNDKIINGLDKSDKTKTSTHGSAVSNMIGASWKNGGLRGVAGGLEGKLKVNMSSAGDRMTANFLPTVDPNDPTQAMYKGKARQFNDLMQIKRAIDNGATIINYSRGPQHPSSDYNDLSNVYDRFLTQMQKDHPKVLFVAAAGNEADEANAKPLDGNNYGFAGKNLPNVLTVGSVNADGSWTNFSNTGDGANGVVDVSAQGKSVPVFMGPDGKPVYQSGTSFATPQITATAAVLKSIYPDLTAEQVKNIIKESATNQLNIPGKKDPVAIDSVKNGGVLQFDKAVLAALKALYKSRGETFPFSEADLLAMSKIEAVANTKKGDPLSFDIKASLTKIGKNGTSVKLDSQGAGAIGGLTKQDLSSAGSVSWSATLMKPEDTMGITITREDSGACTRLALKADNIAGTYKGNIHIAYPYYSEYISKTEFNIPLTFVITEDGNVTIDYSSEDSVSTTGLAGYSSTTYSSGGGKLTGTVNEDLKINATGNYAYHYRVELPGEITAMMPESYKALLSGDSNGDSKIECQLDDKGKITGTMTFSGNGVTTNGDVTATKEE